jgi:dinuclear metal center YbgI/SA1388 family protein
MAESLRTILEFLDQHAPLELAEVWDNVGFLLGDLGGDVGRVMTCLTLTPDVAAEAISDGAELVVSHHPLLFRPVQKLTTETSEGGMLLSLIQAGIAVYSPHTAFDSARTGINQQLAESLELTNIKPIRPREGETGPEDLGSGRYGDLKSSVTLGCFLDRVKSALEIGTLQFVGDPGHFISRVGVGCGSAGEFLPEAADLNCDAFLTGEARFHASLQARSLGVSLILAGHYATERPAVERLAETIQERFPSLAVWPSRVESDPIQYH